MLGESADQLLLTRHLACPKCGGSVRVEEETIACASTCDWRALWKEGIVLAVAGAAPSFFDDKVELMESGHDDAGGSLVFQEAQMRVFADALRPGAVILDVGCGPKAPYKRRRDCTVIGVDLSLASLRANSDMDLRVYASAAELPLPARSIDVIACVYSVHHFVGATVAENRRLLEAAFREFGRVLGRRGELFVFDVSPWRPFGTAQDMLWNPAKRALGKKLDMFFWRAESLVEIGSRLLPAGSTLAVRRFDAPLRSTFAPIFALPKLRVPRALYPFDVNMYHWSL